MTRTTIYQETWPDTSVPRTVKLTIKPSPRGFLIDIPAFAGDPLLFATDVDVELTVTDHSAEVALRRS